MDEVGDMLDNLAAQVDSIIGDMNKLRKKLQALVVDIETFTKELNGEDNGST